MGKEKFFGVLITFVLLGNAVSVTILDSIQNSEDSSSKVSVWAKKAGGRSRSVVTTSTTSQPEIIEIDDKSAFYDSSEEMECPENKFWHLRGKQCVPIVCPWRKPHRDNDTGKCMPEPEPPRMNMFRTSYRQWVYRSPWPNKKQYNKGFRSG